MLQALDFQQALAFLISLILSLSLYIYNPQISFCWSYFFIAPDIHVSNLTRLYLISYNGKYNSFLIVEFI